MYFLSYYKYILRDKFYDILGNIFCRILGIIKMFEVFVRRVFNFLSRLEGSF